MAENNPPTAVPGPTRPPLNALLDDQSGRWRAGERTRVEDYLARYPDIARDTEAVLDLVYHEVVLRERAGERPEKTEYVGRFPDLAGELELQFAIDGLVRRATPPGATSQARSAPGDAPLDPAGYRPDIPGHEVLGLLGRGGMGAVYKALDLRLGRVVAVKVVFDHEREDATERARFRAEAEAIAALDHPHIVRLYEAGESDGLPYFTLEFCPGGSLARTAGPHGVAPREAAAVVEPLARAVAYAHGRNIVHRDLTPGNVLFAADGTPKIADFGLAKRLGSSADLTATAAVLGTPGYMSPEQAAGEGRGAGPAADVYGLGAILYRLLTGRPPFAGDSLLVVIRQVTDAAPAAPSVLQSGIPQDLETICLKCLEKDPRKRYLSAAHLAADLQRFLAGRPIEARPVSRTERAWRWISRNPGWAAALTALGLLLVTIAVGSSVAAVRFNLQRDVAQSNETRALAAEGAAEESRAEAQRLLAESLRSVAGEVRARRLRGERGAYFEGMPKLRATLAQARKLGAQPDVIRAIRDEMGNLLTAADVEVVRGWEDWPEGTHIVAFDPRLERYTRRLVDGTLTVHEVGTGREVSRLPTRVFPDHGIVHLAPGGGRLAYSEAGRRVVCWSLDTPQPQHLWRSDGGNNVAFTPGGNAALVATADNTTRLLDAATGTEIRRFGQGVLAWGYPLHLTRPWAALRSGRDFVAVDYHTGSVVGRVPPGEWLNVCWHPTKPVIALESASRLIRVWDVTAGREVIPPLPHPTAGISHTFSPDGERILSNDWHNELRVWDAGTGRQVFRVPQIWPQHRAFFGSDGRAVAAAVEGRKLQLFRFYPGQGLRMVPRRGAGFHELVSASPDGRLLAINGQLGGVSLHDPETGAELGALPPEAGLLGFAATTGALFTLGARGVERWPVRPEGAHVRVGPPDRVDSRTRTERWGMSANGGVIAAPAFGAGAEIRHRGDPPRWLRTPPQADVRHAAVSPDGTWVAAGSHVSGGVTVYEAADGREVTRLITDGGRAVFSPGGKWVAALGFHGGGNLFRVVDWRQGPAVGGSHVAFHPDDRLVAVGVGYGSVRLLECETGREVVNLEVPDQTRLAPVCFSPRGDRLYAVGLETRGLYIWDLLTLRTRLKEMDADWDWESDSPADKPQPVTGVEVILE